MKIFFSLVIFISLSFVSLVFANPSAKVFPQIQYGYIENKGQLHNQFGELNTEVKYILATPSLSVHLKQTGFSLEMHVGDTPEVKYHRIDISFEGANPYCLIEPDLKASDYLNYYINYTRQPGVHAGKGQTNVAHYGKVTYREVYPGIDIEFLLDKRNGQLQYKYNLIVSPGAELARVRFKVKGAQGITLNGKGNIVFKTSLGQIEEAIPYSYLEASAAQKQEAKVNYQLHNQETFGFSTLVNHQTSKLVIDPIGWATYFGGSVGLTTNSNYGYGISSTNSSYITIGGVTSSINGIATLGSFLGTYQGVFDCFLAKFTLFGTQLWGSYYGGSSFDGIYCLVLDSMDFCYVSGISSSNSGIATLGAFRSRKGGSSSLYAGIFSKFDPNGFLVWGTYLSDSSAIGNTEGTTMGFSPKKNTIFISGSVQNTVGLATAGTHLTVQQGSRDVIIFSFDTSGNRLWSTYYGGTLSELVRSIKPNNSNQVIVGGLTYSSSGIATIGAHKTTIQGNDGFLAKFDSTGNRLWGTYFGGTSNDTIFDLAIDSLDNIFICGSTGSTAGIATTGTYFATNSPSTSRAFVSKFNTLGVRQWGTYYSGNSNSAGSQIGLDLAGNIVLAGTTNATTGIATANTFKTSISGVQDVFLAKLNSSGTARLWGTYFGGNNLEFINDIYINPVDEIYIIGETNSMSGLSSPSAHQTLNLTTNSGSPTANNTSIFLAVFSPLGGLPVTWNTFEVYGQELEQELRASLLWSTASETNNDYFSIERSYNGKEFEEIAQVKGAGNSAKINHYKYFDALNLGLTKDVYYRIKQTDFDGKFAYSEIKKLTYTQALESPFQVFYQDRNVYLKSLGNLQENTHLTLVNMLGQTIWATSIFAGETPVYPIPSKGTPGIYLLRVNGQSGSYTFKVVLE